MKTDSIFISELCYMLAGEFTVWWAALRQKVQGHFLAPVCP